MELAAAFVALEILRSLAWGADHAKAEHLVFQTREQMAKAWIADGGKEAALPKVDFDKETVVAVFGGEKRSGGHAIKIEGISKGLGEVSVLYRETAPAPGSMQTRALTYPSDAAVIRKTAGRFVFVNAATEQGKRLKEMMESAKKNGQGTERSQ